MNMSAFDSRQLKVLSWFSHRMYITFPLFAGLVVLGAYMHIPAGLLFLAAVFGLLYMGLLSDSFLPGNTFASRNKLDKFFMDHATDYVFLKNQYQSLRSSAFLKQENFIWSVPVNGIEVPIMFTNDGGCIAWMQLGRQFPHMVVDSLADNHWLHRQLVKGNLPSERIRPEGNFPDYFHVYQEPGEQVMTLQILSPDRMLYLMEELHDINLEIQDTYLRLYSAKAQDSSRQFQTFLDLLSVCQKGLKVAGISKIL